MSSQTNNMNEGVESCRLIAHQDWEGFRQVLSTESGRQSVRDGVDSLGIDGALHFACRFHPPLDVVVSMVEVFPGAITHSDKAGRYPLHIAAKWGASPLVIRFLVEESPAVVGLQDDRGRTPLHHVCSTYSRNYSVRKNEGIPLKDAVREIVRGLCKANPAAVNTEDEEEMTALEYAIDADVDLKAVRTIQKACEKDWKNRRSQAPGLHHSDVRRNLVVENREKNEKLGEDLHRMTVDAMHQSMSALHTGDMKLPESSRVPPTVRPTKANSCRALTA